MKKKLPFELKLKEAIDGDVESQLAVAISYATGEGAVMDLSLARKWFEAASRQGSPDAMFNLALMLLLGEGGGIFPSRATKLLRKACGLGSSDACIHLGKIHERNSEFESAARLYARAVIYGDVRGLELYSKMSNSINDNFRNKTLWAAQSELSKLSNRTKGRKV